MILTDSIKRNIRVVMTTIEGLENGITNEDGDVRSFDIIDYYQMTKLTPAKMFDSISKVLEKVCTKEEYNTFNKFALKYGNPQKTSIKEIMEIKHSIKVGEELREITDEEKLEAIRFISENGIHLTADVYFAAIKRELNGTLEFKEKEEDNKKVKTL